MTPIISPWTFYLIGLNENLIMASFLTVLTIALIMFGKMLNSHYNGTKFNPKKNMIVVLVVCILVCLFCPTNSTLMKMIVAQNVTYERVEVDGDTVKDIYGEIISLIDNNSNNG